jgi:hypothetical protein
MKKVLTLAVVLTFAFAVQNAVARELSVAGSTTVQKRVLEPAQKAIESAKGHEKSSLCKRNKRGQVYQTGSESRCKV